MIPKATIAQWADNSHITYQQAETMVANGWIMRDGDWTKPKVTRGKAMRRSGILEDFADGLDRVQVATKHKITLGTVDRFVRSRGRNTCVSCETPEIYTLPTRFPGHVSLIEACEQCRDGIYRRVGA